MPSRRSLTLLALLCAGVYSCATDEDCSLLGVCLSASCVCDSGWRGADCGELALAPATRHAGYNRTGESPPTSSWGGRVIADPVDPALHHLFAAEFTGSCGLDFWSPYSRIIRAESRAGPEGPFTFAAEVAPTFAHNPQVAYSAAEGLYLMYHIGCAFPQPAGCTPTALTCAPGNDENGESGISLRVSRDLRTWTARRGYALANGTGGGWDEDTTNPSPLVLGNGSIVLFYRGCPRNCADSEHTELLGFALAAGSQGPYTRATPAPLFPSHPTEDPNVWQDARGHWHVLSHSLEPGGAWGGGGRVGRHGFARSLQGPWTWNSATLAFNTTVHFTDGSVDVLNRRERPQLHFDSSGKPAFLVTGVQAAGQASSYTLIQPVAA